MARSTPVFASVPRVAQRLVFPAGNFRQFGWTPDGGLAMLTTNGHLKTVRSKRSYPVAFLDAEFFAWSPDGRKVVTYTGRQVRIWTSHDWASTDVEFLEDASSAAWSPDSKLISVGFARGGVQILDAVDGEVIHWLDTFGDKVTCCWLDDQTLVAASSAPSGIAAIESIRVTDMEFVVSEDAWDPHDSQAVRQIAAVGTHRYATVGRDRSIRIWEAKAEANAGLLQVIESPEGKQIADIIVSDSGRFVVALDDEGAFFIFDIVRGELVKPRAHRYAAYISHLVGFKRGTDTFAVVDDSAGVGLTYGLSPSRGSWKFQTSSVRYRNAKVVIVGDTGVGKSGLALALTKQGFAPTESTHARHVWSLGVTEEALGPLGEPESHEILLWDLAGQAGYRSFHKLSLRDVAVGLVVFDARSESDPFRGVPFWARALDDVSAESRPVKLLVSARSDRGTVSASMERLEKVLSKYSLTELIETSAKTGEGIAQLESAVEGAINWGILPVIVAPDAFFEVRTFLIDCKSKGWLVATGDRLYKAFRQAKKGRVVTRLLFDLCLQRLETAGLSARLAINDEWLLQPELLDSYVAYMAQAARTEPDGLGRIPEDDAINGNYRHDPLADLGDEKVMLLTAVNEVVARNLALRVATDRGQMLVFPSERRTDLQDYPGGYDLAVEYRFVGSVSSIYAGVAVKLVNSLAYGSTYDLFYNAALFSSDDGVSGFAVDYPESDDESSGRLVVFFSPEVRRRDRIGFLRYVEYQLRHLASAQPERQRIYSCCGLEISATVIGKRSALGETTVLCPVCSRQWSMDDLAESEQATVASVMLRDRSASDRQAKQQRLAVLPSLERANSHHVFLCHNSQDRESVAHLERELREQGILAWTDSAQLLGGRVALREIESVLSSIPAIAVVVGPNSIGRWQEEEYYAALGTVVAERSKGREVRLIPVLLPGAGAVDDLPAFLRSRTTVDMRRRGVDDAEGIRELVAAVWS